MIDSFLQSKQWEEFQKAIGRKVWRLPAGKAGIDDILVIKHILPLGKSYLYCPKPSFQNTNHKSQIPNKSQTTKHKFQMFLDKTHEIAKKENAIFLKIEPEYKLPVTGYPLLITHSIQPQKTSILDLKKSLEELLKAMHQKTRYNIRLAKKKGIKIEESKDIDVFLSLLKKTAKRDEFRLHPDEYYKKMLEVLGKSSTIKLFLAKHKKRYIAGALVVFFNKTAVYLHGASDYEYRSLMAPYLLQWQAILQAKKRKCQYYDFWGIDAKKWPGVTRFKKGFSGKEITYPASFDLIFQPFWYILYDFSRRILR